MAKEKDKNRTDATARIKKDSTDIIYMPEMSGEEIQITKTREKILSAKEAKLNKKSPYVSETEVHTFTEMTLFWDSVKTVGKETSLKDLQARLYDMTCPIKESFTLPASADLEKNLESLRAIVQNLPPLDKMPEEEPVNTNAKKLPVLKEITSKDELSNYIKQLYSEQEETSLIDNALSGVIKQFYFEQEKIHKIVRIINLALDVGIAYCHEAWKPHAAAAKTGYSLGSPGEADSPHWANRVEERFKIRDSEENSLHPKLSRSRAYDDVIDEYNTKYKLFDNRAKGKEFTKNLRRWWFDKYPNRKPSSVNKKKLGN